MNRARTRRLMLYFVPYDNVCPAVEVGICEFFSLRNCSVAEVVPFPLALHLLATSSGPLPHITVLIKVVLNNITVDLATHRFALHLLT